MTSKYEDLVREQIEKEVHEKYLIDKAFDNKRIEYLVGANNELMRELEKCEKKLSNCVPIPNSKADNILLEEES
mgnify:CR=1 FL=1|tara:strand:- start:347 stop:568 length:222 start_codon:yes stop_codon:yes gene_type:complete